MAIVKNNDVTQLENNVEKIAKIIKDFKNRNNYNNSDQQQKL
jgi:hypothetical protein